MEDRLPLKFTLLGVLSMTIPLLAADIHVSNRGADGDPGTRAKPLATLHAAQQKVRAMVAQGLKEPVTVIVHGGTYHLPRPLELRPQDSGTKAFPITWRAPKGEKTVLSGGVPIDGTWTKGEDGVWSVPVPGVTDGWCFRQLFVDGKRAIRARFPNVDEANPFLYATGGGEDHAIIDKGLVKASWGTARNAQINIVPDWRFFNQWNTVTSVDSATGRIDIADSERHGTIKAGNWFWIEGVREELDQPGEWFLDAVGGCLHYMPEPGVDPNTLTIVAPLLNRIVNAQGDVNAGTHVEHLRFEGLEFRHTTFSLGHIEARVHTDAAVMFENTSHCSVTNCHFENIGGYALWLHLDSQRNVFDQNTVRHSGGGGVLLTGSRLSYMDDTKVYTSGAAAARVAPILNEITRNTVEHCGEIRYYGGGVHLDSRPFSMSMAPGNYIAHNHFNDLSRNGVFAFRNQGGNVVEYNHIHNAMQTTIDGACIHFATMNHLNAPNHILNNWLYDIWGYEQKPDGKPKRHLANGVFLDWDTSNTTVRDNYVYNAGGKPIKFIWQNWNIVDKGNQSSATRIVPPFANEVGPAGTATNGIDLATNHLTGSVIHYSDSALVTRTGDWEKQTITGLAGLFEFNLLALDRGEAGEISYALPIAEDGTYQISLLYKPSGANADNARLEVHHARGVAKMLWNMKTGSTHGFAVEVGKYPFKVGEPAQIVISSEGANGIVVADSVAFVKVSDQFLLETKPVRKGTQISLSGILIDERDAVAEGVWHEGSEVPILGPGYLHDGNEDKGTKSMTFTVEVKTPGRYQVRLLYTEHANRATNTPVAITVGDQRKSLTINQKTSDGTGAPLGSFDIKQTIVVRVTTDATNGPVVVDGLQLIAE